MLLHLSSMFIRNKSITKWCVFGMIMNWLFLDSGFCHWYILVLFIVYFTARSSKILSFSSLRYFICIYLLLCFLFLFQISAFPVDTRRCFNVDTTSYDIIQHLIDVETTSCVYGVSCKSWMKYYFNYELCSPNLSF